MSAAVLSSATENTSTTENTANARGRRAGVGVAVCTCDLTWMRGHQSYVQCGCVRVDVGGTWRRRGGGRFVGGWCLGAVRV